MTLREALDHPSIRWLLGGALVLGLITAIVAIPKYQVGADLAAGIIQIADIAGQVDDYRKTVIQVVGGAVVIVGLYLTWRRIQVTEDGQVTERFTKAIEQLGDDRISVRLGGIYALERIAKDATQDHPTVVEVLSAFIRERTRVKPPAPSHTEEDMVEDQDEAVGPETDVQAALTVLGRRVVKNDTPGLRVDIQGAYLFKANLTGADLTGALLNGAYLSRADLGGADLTGAFLIRANLSGANLHRANLARVYLAEADLTEANFHGANLSGADLSEANLHGASLSGASLRKAFLFRANLREANLHGAYLVDANLAGANLTEANLVDANLTGANLVDANLTGVDLTEVNLSGANLTGAMLEGAKGIPDALLRSTAPSTPDEELSSPES